MRVLLLGAGGFIGSNLTQYLLESTGHSVIGLDSDDEKLLDLQIPDDRFSFHKVDVRDSHELVGSLVQKSDVVVDLISYANPSIYISKPLDVVDLNLFQNLRIVDDCVRFKKRLVQFSTSEVYGLSLGRREPFKEDSSDLVMGPVRNQRWIYASTKQLLERIVYAHGDQGELEYTLVRPFNFVGPKIDYLVEAGSTGGPRVFSHFMSALLGGGPLQLVDGGLAHRSFTHISDACSAITLVLEKREDCRNDILNIGHPSNSTTIRELATLMLELYEELTGEKPRSTIVDTSGRAFYGAGYEDCDWRLPDVSKLTALGWKPQLDLRQTFRETMKWYLEQLRSSSDLPSFLRAQPVSA